MNYNDLNGLPMVLGFEGEFGAELNTFLPFIFWLHKRGLMKQRRVETYLGMRPFYYFLTEEQVVESGRRRRYVPSDKRPTWLPNRYEHDRQRSIFESFPDYRSVYAEAWSQERPIVVVHNKYTREWGRPPINFFSLRLLREIFDLLSKKFEIVYVPALPSVGESEFSFDHQENLQFEDRQFVARDGRANEFEAFTEQRWPKASYNERKLRLYANVSRHVTVQGGNAHLLAFFSGGSNVILHRFGQEIRGSYCRGHFAYASTPPPRWWIARTSGEVLEAVAAIATECAKGEETGPESDEVYRKFSPHIRCDPAAMLLPEAKSWWENGVSFLE
jgi:hypothetical protein